MSEEPLRHLSREECLRLLDHERLGRVAVSVGALPAILPVNYTVSEGAIVLRTGPGTKLSAALMNTVVGFEIDSTDAHHTSGWSVLVVGHASEVQDDATLERLRRLPLESWSSDHRDHFVAISIEQVSGRAFGRIQAIDSASGPQSADDE
jgi:nitroimidazol reductase NimA-like FMN-containing flavoprotein (pyridoxamine 5'-phosphate oxidase superfamily)